MLERKPDFRQDLLDYIVRHRPVDASFIGLHERDHFLPDLSEAGIQETLTGLGRLREAVLRAPPPSDRWETLDRQLIEGFLAIQQWELQSNHFHWGNPSFYTGEAIFGVLSLFLSSFAPPVRAIGSRYQPPPSHSSLADPGAPHLADIPSRLG